MSTGLTHPIVHSNRSIQAGYNYRNGMGMVPSAEWYVFFDDFDQFVVATSITNGPVAQTPWGWQGAVIDSGTTATLTTTAAIGATGALLISDATASEGAAIYKPKDIQLTSGKRFMMETRVYTDDVADNAIQMGVSDLTATTNPEDLYTTAAANLVSFGILDGDTYTGMLSDAGNSGTSVQVGTVGMSASTWTTLAIHYDGTYLSGWVNGRKSLTWSSAAATIPTGVALAPFIAARNGDGAGGNANYFDWVRVVIER